MAPEVLDSRSFLRDNDGQEDKRKKDPHDAIEGEKEMTRRIKSALGTACLTACLVAVTLGGSAARANAIAPLIHVTAVGGGYSGSYDVFPVGLIYKSSDHYSFSIFHLNKSISISC